MYSIVMSAAMLAIACGGKKSEDKPKPGSGTDTGSAAAKFDGVEVFVDGKSVAKVATADVAQWPRLVALVPEDDRRLGTWDALEFKPAGDPLKKPSASYPDKLPIVFPGKDGKPAFGMFDAVELANKGNPAFRVDGITEIRITVSKVERSGMHQGTTGEAADPTKLVLPITTPDAVKTLTGPEIMKLPRIGQPNQEDAKGWTLFQLFEAAGVTKYEKVTLIGANAMSVPLDKQELDPATTLPFIKLNKAGALRFRMYTKKGDAWVQGADLRELISIKVQ